MGPVLALVLGVGAVVELIVLIQVGQALGALPTVLLLVVVAALGAALLRREGARSWRAFSTALHRGTPPVREVADGALVLLAGALLVAPGFVSDVVALLLLVPPVRAVARRLLAGWVARRVVAPGARRRPPPGGRIVHGTVVDGTVVDGTGADGTGADAGHPGVVRRVIESDGGPGEEV